MAKQVLMYEKAVPVSGERHRDWSVKMGEDHGFARDIGWVPLVVGEFAAAAHEYPIVFAPSGGDVVPVAVLGLTPGQNMYLDEHDKWNASYIPAFVRRYPFIFSSSQDGQTFALCIDEEYEGFNQDGRGERLLDSEGNQTQYCQNVMGFLSRYQAEFARTQAFCKKLIELELLESQSARLQDSGGATRGLTGFQGISHPRLKALPGEKLSELAMSDELDLAWLQLFSLGNLRKLAERGATQAKETSKPSPLDGTFDDAETLDQTFAGDADSSLAAASSTGE